MAKDNFNMPNCLFYYYIHPPPPTNTYSLIKAVSSGLPVHSSVTININPHSQHPAAESPPVHMVSLNCKDHPLPAQGITGFSDQCNHELSAFSTTFHSRQLLSQQRVDQHPVKWLLTQPCIKITQFYSQYPFLMSIILFSTRLKQVPKYILGL